MKSLRKIIAYLIASTFVLVAAFGVYGGLDVYAEDVSIILAIWPLEAQVGDLVTATITINGDNLGEYDIFLEYPSELLSYNGGETTGSVEVQSSGSNTLSYTFTAVAEGSGKIQTSGYKIYDTNGQQLSVVHAGGNIVVGQVEETDDKIRIGNDSYTLVNDKKLPSAPENYSITSVTYNDKEIYAYQAPNQNLKVVCLQNADWEQKWFVYDEETQEFSPYVNYTLDGISYVVINKPNDIEIPDYYSETSLTLDGSTLVAYTDESDNGLYLVYALNQTGDGGLYFFDTNEGSFLRYDAITSIVDYELSNSDKDLVSDSETTTEKDKTGTATPLIPNKEKSDNPDEENGLLSKASLQKILYMMVVLFIVMCVVVIILVIRIGMLQSQLYGEDYGDDDDDDYIAEKAKKDAKKTAQRDASYNVLEKSQLASQDEDSGQSVQKPKDPMTESQIKTGKSNSYAVNEDTGEILLVEAADNNAGVNVPPAEDVDPSKIEKAMAERPYGYDSAFDVVTAEEAPEGDHVYREPEPEMGQFIDPSKFDAELERRNLNAKNMIHAIAEEDRQSVDTDEPDDIDESVQQQPTTVSMTEVVAPVNAEQVLTSTASGNIYSEETDDEKESGKFLSKRKKNRKNRKNKKNKEKIFEPAIRDDIANAEQAVQQNVQSEQAVQQNIQPEQPVEDIAELPTEVLTMEMAQQFAQQSTLQQSSASVQETVQQKPVKKKKTNTPQKVALPGMDEEDDE